MMFSWISEVPPSMELPRARSQLRVRASSPSSKPGPSQPRPAGPAIVTASSLRRLLSSVAKTLKSELCPYLRYEHLRQHQS